MFLTTNYDLFIEQAIKRILGYEFNSIDSYLPQNDKWMLVKLHGSVNWVKTILNKFENINAPLSSILNNLSEDLKLDNSIVLLNHYQDNAKPIAGKLYYPVIAVPLTNKKQYVCENSHLEAAQTFLSQCNYILIIGFSALDKHILDLFKLISSFRRIKLVNGSINSAKDTLTRISSVNNAFSINRLGKDSFYESGFNDFVKSGELYKFLNS